MEQLQENESKLINKFQWFLFVGVIPLLFAVIVSIVVLTFAGVDVAGAIQKYGQHIPGVSKLLPAEEGTIDLEAKLKQDVSNLEATNQENLTMIEQLEKEAEVRETEMSSLQAQIEDLTEQLKAKELEQQETKQTIDELSKIYESMSSKNAAAILSELDDQDALTILRALSTEALGSILEKMEPTDAARFTKLLADET
ncbi:MotE family protein [Bacillus pinisoli]|uniref:MotE family protein n=1 Tax=Bacillus pinisoli TaxID=2901866 RepID=UPI001FF504A8|nr:MotE family protein [Bacillus pinisoli]